MYLLATSYVYTHIFSYAQPSPVNINIVILKIMELAVVIVNATKASHHVAMLMGGGNGHFVLLSGTNVLKPKTDSIF